MDYEQKYKEAFERAKGVIEQNPLMEYLKKGIEYILSELKESEDEDEKIRKELICFLETEIPQCSARDKYIAWLEKQGEQKYAPAWMTTFLDELRSKKHYFEWDEHKDIEGKILAIIRWMNPNYFNEKEVNYPKFDYDDILAIQCCMKTAEKVTEDKELYEKLKSLHSRLHDVYWLVKQGEQKQDPCDNCKDVMLNCHNFPCVKKKAFKQGKSVLELIKEESQVYKTGDDEIITYSETDGYKLYQPKFKVGDTMRTLQEASNGITSGLPVVVSIDNEYYHCNNELIAIKNQDNYEYPPMNRRQKPAWSYEDEANLNNIIWLCNNCIKGSETTWIPSQATKIKHLIETIKEKGFVQQNPAWSEEDNQYLCGLIGLIEQSKAEIPITLKGKAADNCIDWLKSIKKRVQPQNSIVTDEELIQAKKEAYNDALNKIEYHSGEPSFDDGWSAATWYFKKRNMQPQPKQEWSEEDEKKRNLLIDILNVNHPNGVFKVNPINTSNMEAMHIEELVSWLKSLEDRVQQQPKQKCSEWDRSKIQRICKYLDEAKKYYADITEVRECIDWLKSLRPQSTWKPSDEQIKAVRLARSFVTDDFGENHTLSDVLVELEKQLKKLK